MKTTNEVYRRITLEPSDLSDLLGLTKEKFLVECIAVDRNYVITVVAKKSS